MKNKAKKILNKKPVKIIVVTIVFLICLFGIIPLFINFLINTTNPFDIGFINETNKDSWINFFGTVIGGVLTLLGVWWTINDQERKRYEDLAMQYKPILKAIPPVNDDEKRIIINSDDTTLLFNMILYIENIGRGEALDIEISNSECNDLEENLKSLQRNTRISICNHFKSISIIGTELECLPANNNKQLMIQLLVSKYYKEHDVFCFNLDIRFKNTFSKKAILHHRAKIVIRNNKSLNLKDYDENYSALITNKYYTN